MKAFDDCTDAQKIERWENVERVLKALSPHERRKHWDMSDWGQKTSCGTVACAAGHCGLDPWFRRRGFKMDFTKDIFGYWGAEMPVEPEDFFGYEGCRAIFFNSDRRPVSKVITEVRAYIRELRSGG